MLIFGKVWNQQLLIVPSLFSYVFYVECQKRFRLSGSIVSDYGLDDRANGVRSSADPAYFFSSLCVQTGSGAHPASYPIVTAGSIPEGKARPLIIHPL
jgi:hypothetical protein